MKKKYAGVNNGKVEAAINMLGGMDGVRDLLAGKVSVLSATQKLKMKMGVLCR